jgi:hypothetical protein
MTAFREDGSRTFYVEHVCGNATGMDPGKAHVHGNKVIHTNYIVRMFYIGDLNPPGDLRSAKPEDFEYMTDMMPFPGNQSSGYTNCPLCGSPGRIKVDDSGMVPIYEEIVIPISE